VGAGKQGKLALSPSRSFITKVESWREVLWRPATPYGTTVLVRVLPLKDLTVALRKPVACRGWMPARVQGSTLTTDPTLCSGGAGGGGGGGGSSGVDGGKGGSVGTVGGGRGGVGVGGVWGVGGGGGGRWQRQCR
jgi:hypothetical protein